MSVESIAAGGSSQAQAARQNAIIQAAANRQAAKASQAQDSDGDNDGSKAGEVENGGKIGPNINLTA